MNEERQILENITRFLVNEIVSEISGRKNEICVGDVPRVKYFAGVLKPEKDEEIGEVYSKASPSTASADFLLSAGTDGSLTVEVSFDIYYRIFPPFEIYVRHGFDEKVYRKKRVNIGPVMIDRRDLEDLAAGMLHEVAERRIVPRIVDEMERVKAEIQNDPLIFKKLRHKHRIADVENEREYLEFIASLDGEPVLPEIRPEISLRARRRGKGFEITVSLTNKSPEMLNADDREIRRLDIDNALYDFKILVKAEGDFRIEPYRFYMLPEDYRYNREMWGIGTNCTVEKFGNNAIITEHTPVFEQKKYDTRNVGDTRFSSLSRDPVPALREIERLMWEYHAQWASEIESMRSSIPDDEYRARKRDLEQFEREIRRFSNGIHAIERYDLVKNAFKLLNRTYEEFSARKGFDRWKLFQLVFIVSCIPDIASIEFPELCGNDEECNAVDVLWFPTGGGKTEAYLGLVVFAAFFDRLRGKHSGTTAMMRYPLRLLSLQQLQRICEIFAMAEKVRLSEGIQGDEFSVGFLTGDRNIPNSLDRLKRRYDANTVEELAESFSRDEATKRACKVIDSCPFCGGEVDVVIDPEKYSLLHICSNPECDRESLPVYVIDRDVYRFLPTMIVGVQDKITMVSSQKRFGAIFGNIYGKCPQHGFTVSKKCDVFWCREKIERVDLKDPAPTIQIQDELHLLKEELGTFESHYFGLIDYLTRRNNGREPKIIAATATIEEYENQVRHLYRRKSRRFPEEGPGYRNSFYATTSDALQRIFVGVLPVNVTHINAVVRILMTYHELIQNIERSPEKYAHRIHESLSPEDLKRIIQKYYKTSVTYVLAKREGDRLSRSVETQINPQFSMNGYRELSQSKLTGETEFKEVARLIGEFKTGNQPDVVISTSTISHGVDLENLNFMLFFGMPRMVAEYIQSSSRVGRHYPGIVITCFHPIRERDRSHYKYFKKFHEYLDRLVEPVPVNRWSKMGIKKSLPGVFMGLILQVYGPVFENEKNMNLIYPEKVARAFENHDLKEEEIIEKLLRIYDIPSSGNLSESISNDIRDLVETFFSEICSGRDFERYTWKTLKRYPPMRSLRDVDELVEILTRG